MRDEIIRLWASLYSTTAASTVHNKAGKGHTSERAIHMSAGVKNYMVGALDPETADRLQEIGAPHFVLFDVAENGTALGLGPKDLAWGSPAFHSMGRVKINLLKTFLAYDLDVLLCDTDTVWIKDPTPYLLQYPSADILISTDHMLPTVEYGDTGLEKPSAAHSAMNIGVMFFRSTAPVQDFVEQWVVKLDEDPGAWDQVCISASQRTCVKVLCGGAALERAARLPEKCSAPLIEYVSDLIK